MAKDNINILVQRRRAAKAPVEEHGRRCKEWHTAQSQNHANELKAARERREAAIWQKLRDAGWAETLDRMNNQENYEPRRHPLVRQSKDLTDRIWDNIKGTLTEQLQKIMVAHLEHLRITQLRKRVTAVNHLRLNFLKHHGKDTIVPSLANLCFMKEFKSLLDMPAEVDATDDMFSEAAKCLPDLCIRWRKAAEQDLVALTRPVNVASEPDSTDERLKLATSAFVCMNCSPKSLLDPVQALEHPCCVTSRTGAPSHGDVHERYSVTGGNPWHAHGILDLAPASGLLNIIEQCGMVPSSATWAEMDKLDSRFTCTHCNHGDHMLVMTWRQTVEHAFSSTLRPTLCAGAKALSLLSGPELSAILQEELEAQGTSYPIWCCSLCDVSFTFAALTAHLLNKHAIGKVDKESYYFNHRQRFVTRPWWFKRRIQDAEQDAKQGVKNG